MSSQLAHFLSSRVLYFLSSSGNTKVLRLHTPPLHAPQPTPNIKSHILAVVETFGAVSRSWPAGLLEVASQM